MKQCHAYRVCGSTYNGEILNSFNPEMQFKDTTSAISNKLIDLLTELKGFKFVVSLVSEFEKIEHNDETKCSTFYSTSKAETITIESEIDDVFDLFIL